MSDIVERLNEGLYDQDIPTMLGPLLDEAAAEITNLRAESRRDADEIALLRVENEKLCALASQLLEKVVRLKLALGEPRHEE